MSSRRYKYCTAVAPGCHGGPDEVGAIVSRHYAKESAVRKAKKSDRLVACELEHGTGISRGQDWPGRVVFQGREMGHPRHGEGRYGRRTR